ncbi:MAG: hypothetical protein IPJ01_12035 [Micavibrio sp.]|nr:hypothetical protein [Micavibrio sp.]
MISDLQNLQTQLIAAGFETNLTFGRSIATDLTKDNIAAGRLVLFFPVLDTDAETMTWQKSPVIALKGTISAYAKTDLDTVQLLHAALAALGFKRENGDVGKPPRFPQDFQLGAIKILWITCPGGVRATAQPAGGDIWAIDQNVELAFYTP